MHPNIEGKKLSSAFQFSRKITSKDYNYFSCIYTEPIEKEMKLSIIIDGIHVGDPYLDIGFMDEVKFKTYKSSPVVSFASGTVSYCGTS